MEVKDNSKFLLGASGKVAMPFTETQHKRRIPRAECRINLILYKLILKCFKNT